MTETTNLDNAPEDFTDEQLEKRVQEKGLNAPRLTPELIDSVIAKVEYYVFPGSLMTVCCMTLMNGYNVTGESSCVSKENFDAQIGKDVAYKKAKEKVWGLEGYKLKEALYQASKPDSSEEPF